MQNSEQHLGNENEEKRLKKIKNLVESRGHKIKNISRKKYFHTNRFLESCSAVNFASDTIKIFFSIFSSL